MKTLYSSTTVTDIIYTKYPINLAIHVSGYMIYYGIYTRYSNYNVFFGHNLDRDSTKVYFVLYDSTTDTLLVNKTLAFEQ